MGAEQTGAKMTVQVQVKASGKIEGIRGLYKDSSSLRYYVRYAKGGIDRQMTILPKGETYTALSRAASKALTQLKREVEIELGTETKGKSSRSCGDVVLEGVQALPATIEALWGLRGVSARTIKELKNYTSGLALCGVRDKKLVEAIDAHNRVEMAKKLENEAISACTKAKMHSQVKAVFKSLIEKGRHYGENPAISFEAPKHQAQREEREITFEDMAKILATTKAEISDAVRQAEITLFFRLLTETGQRPIDLYRLDVRKIQGRHYRFASHKTGKIHRVAHQLSDTTLALIEEIKRLRAGRDVYVWEDKNSTKGEKIECFWSIPWRSVQSMTRAICTKALGAGAKLYTTRHFFISEIFRRTQSDFWAGVFTHEGEGANQKNYLHVNQAEADQILMGFLEDFESVVSKGEVSKSKDEDEFLKRCEFYMSLLPA